MNSRHHHTIAMYSVSCCCYDYDHSLSLLLLSWSNYASKIKRVPIVSSLKSNESCDVWEPRHLRWPVKSNTLTTSDISTTTFTQANVNNYTSMPVVGISTVLSRWDSDWILTWMTAAKFPLNTVPFITFKNINITQNCTSVCTCGLWMSIQRLYQEHI